MSNVAFRFSRNHDGSVSVFNETTGHTYLSISPEHVYGDRDAIQLLNSMKPANQSLFEFVAGKARDQR